MMVDSPALVVPAPAQDTSREPMDRLDAAHALLGAASESQPAERRPRSGSVGLDELAELAAGMSKTNSVSQSPSSSDDDSEAMPPPPARRPRSCSNPEGMERFANPRQDFVLPLSILEEELKSASALAKAHEASVKKRAFDEIDNYGTSPDSVVTSPIMLSASKDEAYLEEEDLQPEELLRRARSRLLEDLSEGSLKGEKGVLTLPHSLSKYKETYNKNGRIGIYTPAERAAIIARFHDKRSRRVWNKKIRYGCRKNLADRRLRVKGRFVKRKGNDDALLPDVNDPEAGFAPTAELPFRRRRRHTIT